MERLQSAIAKARASRQSLTGGPSHDPVAGAPAPAPSVTEAWAALPLIDINDDLLIQNRIMSVGRGSEAVEFDKLRTRVLQRMQGKGWTRLAITSPGPGCGKSTIALNLAFGLSRQEGARVLLLEMDMRRPSFRRMLGIDQGFDISRAFAGSAAPEDHMFRARDNLAIGITARVSQSAELLQSGAMAEVLDQIQSRFQPTIVIFDLPPFKVSDDTLSFMNKTETVMIVAAAGQTSIDELDDCERELASQTEVLGVVLNKCRDHGQDGQYYYYG